MDAPLIDLHTRRVDFDVSVRAAKRRPESLVEEKRRGKYNTPGA